MEEIKGVLYGVSVGPGDWELITIKAVRILKDTQIIAVPKSGGKRNAALEIISHVVNIDEKTLIELDFPMIKDENFIREKHRKNAEIIENKLKAGNDVAFISIGDISIYSTFGYINDLVKNDGYKTAMISGVPSFCAVSAVLGISLTEKDKPVLIIPASAKNGEMLCSLSASKVLMKSGDTHSLKKLLANCSNNVFYAVSDCGWESQKIFDITKTDENTGYFTTVIAKDV